MRLAAISWTGAFTACLLASATASADPGVHTVTRVGEARPWIYQGMPTGVTGAARPNEARARAVLAALTPDRLAARVELAKTSETTFDADTIVRFEQTHRGLPVVGRGATVSLDPRGAAKVSVVRLEEDLPASIVPRTSAESASRTAAAIVRAPISEHDASLVVWTGRDRARLAWVVLPKVPAGFGAPRVVVDADTGAVIEARDLAVYAKAKVYASNPTASPDLQLVDLPMAIDGTKLENAFVKSQNCVDKKSVRDVSFVGFAFKVHICDLEQDAAPDVDGNFVYAPSDEAGKVESRSDTFSEVSMYYHAARAYQFYRGLAGDANLQVVVEKPLRTISNLQIADGLAQQDFTKAANPDVPLQPFQNAFYSPAGGGLGQIFEQLYGFSDGAMWFGQGPKRDYSYDGDVVYHEFTHGVVNATLRLEAWHLDKRGAIDSPGAMNEGLADYFSSAITGDPKVGEYASKDISSTLDVIRTLDNKDTCGNAIIGEVHFDSTLFSGGLWEARSKLPAGDRTKFDAALYKAMRTHAGQGDLGYEDLAQLFLTQLQTDLPAGATALSDVMKARGVLPACERIVDFTGAPIKAPAAGGGAGFAAPGKQSLGSSGDLAPGIIQIHQKLAANTVKAKVSFSAKVQAAGGGGPFGGGGKPFAPVVVFKTGQAITWTTKGKLAHDGTAVDATAAGSTYTAELEIPADATDLYVQIASKGDSDGSYDAVTIATEAGPAPPAGTTDPPKSNPAASSSSDDSGCRAAPIGSKGGLFTLGAVGLVGLAAAARRRRR